MAYKLKFSASVEHDLRKLDSQLIDHVFEKLKALLENPFTKGVIKLKNSINSYRMRVGDYRIIYQVDAKNKFVTVIHIRHRKEVYKRLKH